MYSAGIMEVQPVFSQARERASSEATRHSICMIQVPLIPRGSGGEWRWRDGRSYWMCRNGFWVSVPEQTLTAWLCNCGLQPNNLSSTFRSCGTRAKCLHNSFQDIKNICSQTASCDSHGPYKLLPTIFQLHFLCAHQWFVEAHVCSRYFSRC